MKVMLTQAGPPASVRYRHLSVAWGVPGLVTQVAAAILMSLDASIGRNILIGIGLTLGTVLLMIGSAYYAKSKGRHPAWCLLAILNWIGLFYLARLEDRSRQSAATELLIEAKQD